VTFTLPGEVGAGHVALCGDFNDWSAGSIALHRGSDGAWQVTLPLEPGQSYRFRFLLNGERWENACQADWYEPNPFGSTNSVVVVNSPEAFGLAA
jgi:1,4-alpha-glucan branching enzyme